MKLIHIDKVNSIILQVNFYINIKWVAGVVKLGRASRANNAKVPGSTPRFNTYNPPVTCILGKFQNTFP